MKVLAVVATVFMPLTLLVGIYGMNFDYMPELGWHWGYFVILGVIIVAIAVILWRFWASGWIARSRRRMSQAISFMVDPKKLIGYTVRNIKHNR
jgi:hypothetical protein